MIVTHCLQTSNHHGMVQKNKHIDNYEIIDRIEELK